MNQLSNDHFEDILEMVDSRKHKKDYEQKSKRLLFR